MSTLWGISFDATPISGVIVEFIKLARIFKARGHRVHLDLGYDIKVDKGSFFRPYKDEADVLPDWIVLDRIEDIRQIDGYTPSLVAAVLDEVIGRGDDTLLRPAMDSVSAALRERILAKWEDLGVSFVIVENGTLPENVIYTSAIYQAIEEYGRRHRLGRFVLWRDHDLMWQSEPSSGKYGQFPYPNTPRPVNSPFIHYVVLHDEARWRVLDWTPHLRELSVLPNTFSHRRAEVNRHNAGFRADHGIPEHAALVARCTRIVPPKRIDRDLHLISALRDAYLFVAGDPAEDPAEFGRLGELASRLGVSDRVVFGGRLRPYDAEPGEPGYSVRDLLAHATVASFLTSYDYESYGNPIGEAIAAGVPYLTSRYELYQTVYGDKGFLAPVLDIRADDLPTPSFVDEVAELLTDETRRAKMAEHNYALGTRHFDEGQAESLLDRLFFAQMGERVRASVVLPVYNEAANLPGVLDSLYHQRGLDHAEYEIVLVDNNSTDGTATIARRFAEEHPDLAVYVVPESEQGVACARRTGMDFASARSKGRGSRATERFLLVSADADCQVDAEWLFELCTAMESGKAAIGVCDYFYTAEHFAGRPRLWDAISRTLRCRAVTFALFGGFPDGKGFAVDRDAYDRVGGVEIFYQLKDGRFVSHLSDDWDFGIKVRGSGEDILYASRSRVEINPRRVDHAIDEVIAGRAYGSDGTIVMRDIRVADPRPRRSEDLSAAEALQAWEFSIKDFTPKNTILPVLLTPSLLYDEEVIEFFGADLAERLGRRIAEIKDEMRVVDFTPIHSYKTPCYRLYFEFADEIFARLRARVGEDVGYPPPLPPCLTDVPANRFAEFVKYYCEDRESGEAHNYFGNGGVF